MDIAVSSVTFQLPHSKGMKSWILVWETHKMISASAKRDKIPSAAYIPSQYPSASANGLETHQVNHKSYCTSLSARVRYEGETITIRRTSEDMNHDIGGQEDAPQAKSTPSQRLGVVFPNG